MRELTEREKILLFVLGIVTVAGGFIQMYAYHLEDRVERLWNLYLAERLAIRRSNIDEHPGNGITYSLHEEFENSRIVGIDAEKQEVEVWLVESRLYLLFKPDGPDHLKKFRKGYIAPVTVIGFDYSRDENIRCDILNSSGVVISNGLVKVVECEKAIINKSE